MSKKKTSKSKAKPKVYTYSKTVHFTYTFYATSDACAQAIVNDLRNEDFDEEDTIETSLHVQGKYGTIEVDSNQYDPWE